MARRCFFSFHYQDVIDFRANVVRNHNITKDDNGGFFDASIWETAKKQGDIALKRLINGGLNNTSATVVLIGSSTVAELASSLPPLLFSETSFFMYGNSTFSSLIM